MVIVGHLVCHFDRLRTDIWRYK